MTAVSSSVLVSSLSSAVLPVLARSAGSVASSVDKALPAPKAEALAGATDKAHTPAGEYAAQAAKTPASAMAREELAKQVHELQSKMDKLNPALAFVLDQDSGRALIQLTDRATKEVILQYPTQAALQISKALDQFQKGQLLSKQA